LLGLGPIAVVAGAFRNKSLRYANENLLKFKMRVAIVETAPQCLLKSYIFALGHLQMASFQSASGAAQLGSLIISCISVGWTVSYRFLRALQSDCDGEFCFPVSDTATDTGSLAQRTESLTTLSSGSTASRGLLLDHVCLSPWTLVLLRTLCSSDVLLHVLRWTVFAVAFRGYVVIPLVVMFLIACWSHAGHINSSLRRSASATFRALGHAAAVGITALFINAFVIGEREKGHFEHAAFWWLLDEVVVTLFLVGSVLYASHLPSVSGASARGMCDEHTRSGQVCIPVYFLLTLALLWACTQLMYGLVFITMTCRRWKRSVKARSAVAVVASAVPSQQQPPEPPRQATVPPRQITVSPPALTLVQRESSWGAIIPAPGSALPNNAALHSRRLQPPSVMPQLSHGNPHQGTVLYGNAVSYPSVGSSPTRCTTVDGYSRTPSVVRSTFSQGPVHSASMLFHMHQAHHPRGVNSGGEFPPSHRPARLPIHASTALVHPQFQGLYTSVPSTYTYNRY
jgi:hypothetical protein